MYLGKTFKEKHPGWGKKNRRECDCHTHIAQVPRDSMFDTTEVVSILSQFGIEVQLVDKEKK